MEIREEGLERIKEILRVSQFCRQADTGVIKRKESRMSKQLPAMSLLFQRYLLQILPYATSLGLWDMITLQDKTGISTYVK